MDSQKLQTTIVGIDPGLNTTGYGVLEFSRMQPPKLIEAGIVRGGSSRSLEKRLHEIFKGVQEVLGTYKPQAVAVEQLYSHYDRPQTAILMGHARGVICLAATLAGIPVKHYASTQVKRMLTGNGRAPKRQVQLAICRELGLVQPPEPPDVADALAIALCHYHLDRSDDSATTNSLMRR